MIQKNVSLRRFVSLHPCSMMLRIYYVILGEKTLLRALRRELLTSLMFQFSCCVQRSCCLSDQTWVCRFLFCSKRLLRGDCCWRMSCWYWSQSMYWDIITLMMDFIIKFNYYQQFICFYSLHSNSYIIHNNFMQSQKEQLQKFWNQLGFQTKQYITKPQLINFTQKLLTQKKVMETVPNQSEMEKLIDQYVSEIHEVNADSIQNVEFKYDEAVQFYQWLTGNQQRNQSKVTNVQENQSAVEIQGQKKEEEEEKAEVNKQEKEEEKHMQNKDEQKHQEEKEEKEEKKEEDEHKNEQEETYLYPHNVEGEQEQIKNQQNENEFNQFADDEELSKNQENISNSEKISSNYRLYLNIIFEHYCRMSYATGNDPTFQQIQQKTQIMTINKFMIFCKEFGIVKLSNVNRSSLVELFKKNAQFFKQMNFEQFLAVLNKISKIVFGDGDGADSNEGAGKEFQRMLLFMEVNNSMVFKKKMASLNISYRVKGNQEKQKKQPINYKFKYMPNNGKSKEQVKTEIEERKKIRSENKQTLSKRKPDKNSIKKENEERNVKNRPDYSTPGANKKVLAPPIPPARKSTKGHRSQTLNNVTGYSNIHRLKMQKNLQQPQNIDPRLRLNSIVEEARKMIHSNEADQNYQKHSKIMPRDSSQRNLHSEEAIGHRYMNHSQRSDDIFNSRNDSPVKYMYKKNKDDLLRSPSKREQNDLNELIGDESEEDEYLVEHLERQKKNDHLAQRIEAKIQKIKGIDN